MFAKVLVANRGEIAIRVMRTLEEMGIGTIAVYSEADRDAPHAKRADESYLIGPGPPNQSYLVVDKLIETAKQAGAEAIHPGYGLLAENSAFARACEKATIVFIGPPPKAIDAMGSKTRAREIMEKAGVPIVPGTTDAVDTVEDAKKIIDESIGYPVAIKAAGGGGGKGFRVALEEKELEKAFEGAAREGEKFFKDATVYIERYLPDPRHVEVQILADEHGNVIHLFERDCSVQRRHQKMVEESPSPSLPREVRKRMHASAVRLMKQAGYTNAGTVEFLVDRDNSFYFIEVNARIQVEHPVTEMVTGVDLVKEQIRLATGEKLGYDQDDVHHKGCAIEVRVNAEDPANGFRASPGKVTSWMPAGGPGVRLDSHVYPGYVVPPNYDSLIAKLIVHKPNRRQALASLGGALHEVTVAGNP